MNTNEWSTIDNTHYGKQKISNMLWSNDDILKDNVVCSGYLGLIAVLLNKDKLDNYKKEDNLKIYSNIGRLISSCRLNYDGLICFGWNKNNELVLLFKDNIVRVYSCFCEKIFVFSLDENIKNEGISYGRICEDGIIIITEKLNIYVNYGFSGTNCIKYPNVELKGKPFCVSHIDEDQLNDELNIEQNYFDTKPNNDILRLNIKNYITNTFEKKESPTQNLNSKNNVLIESKENYNIKWQQLEHNQINEQNEKKKKNTTKNNINYNDEDNDNYYFNNKRHKRILIKTTAYDLNNKTDVDAVEKIKTKDKQNKGKNDKNDTNDTNENKNKSKNKDNNKGNNKELNIHLIITLCNGGFVLVNKYHYKYYDMDCSHPYINMSISKSGTILAFLADNGIIKIYLINNLNKCIEETVLDNKKTIKQIVWCGDDCLAVYIPMITPSNYIQHMLFIGGPQNQWIPYQYRHDLFLIGDLYGVKIISKEHFEYISRIRKSTFNIFSIGSCTPSAMLFYSYEKYKNGNICLDDEIRAFNNNLDIAIEECLNAATHEYDDNIINLLLETCLFGKNFMKTNHDSKKYLLCCLFLRICMNVRKPPLDIFITAAELQYITIPTFVHYLAKRKEYFLAYRICEYAGIKTDNILIEWCKEKIEKSIELTDEQLCSAITEKIGNKKNMDYSFIAFMAAKCLRPQLATVIIQYEENKKKQIDMLLKLANYRLAIEKAILSKDIELVYMCIVNILNQEKLNANGEKELTTLLNVLNNNSINNMNTLNNNNNINNNNSSSSSSNISMLASNCFYVYCKKTKQYNLLKEFYEKNGQHSQAAFVTLDLAFSKKNTEQKKTWLAYSAGFLTTDQMNSHIKFVHTSIMNNIDLLNYQKELEMKYNKKLVAGYPHKIQGLSLMKTVEYTLSIGEFLDADNIFKKFKISEPKFWRCKIHTLAKNKYFDELYNFANYRVSPIGMDYFIECVHEYGSKQLTVKLIEKNKDLNSQYKWYTKLNMKKEAEEVLKQMNSQKITSSIFQTITDAISNIR
ncbi:vacuolar protein sorting-associated protein 16, putative [Plasmodium sp. gorilla clade G2]|uniref:vacuolar protein sorting-associated protein 16, putative n=1 Tax=Plasmodium sp. gorilla clade G2 TaxID=880535 RepID=UPI000D2212E8|nr:vacuolar protein sorting-associated protein 16, putative [Plasmodium sp. gorilla clade G2]SOV17047.1 vacuolar protein sorting-associated protein 16, putative [Plasmodium sp. gorilla clade G2]